MNVSPTSHVLATKFLTPPRRPDVVERQRLIQRLSAGVRQNHRRVLVFAPAQRDAPELPDEERVRGCQETWLPEAKKGPEGPFFLD
jgi:hypothetical protein